MRLHVPASLLALAILHSPASATTVLAPRGQWRAASFDRALLERSPRIAARAHAMSAHALDATAVDAVLARAPREGLVADEAALPVLALPRPDGTFAPYRVEESPVMDAELSARFPQIRTYALAGADGAVGRLARTPHGVSALVIESGRSLRVESLGPRGGALHVAFVESDLADDSTLFCGTEGTIGLPPLTGGFPAPRLASGATLRTYRLAVATTGEFYAARGGTDGQVLAAIATDINLVNLRYGIELAINLVIINSTTDVFYTNAGTDPYTDGVPCTMRGEAQADILAVIGAPNFDIGHVIGAVTAGGCAGGANVCTAAKANGASTLNTDLAHPPGHVDYGGYRLLMHEMGHQFGASHTWNASNNGNCTPAQYAQGDAAEPSSGTTIMSYSGTCGPDDIRSGVADDYFHTISYDRIITFSTSGAGDTCALASASGNSAPTVDAGPDYTIPRGTPFTLTGAASDPDGHPLTLTWEQVDLGLGQLPPNFDDGGSPLFRSFPPAPDGDVRTFPQWPVVLGDLPTQVGETLPTTDRVMTFRLVARDDRPVGGVEYDTTVITSDGSPLTVTAPGTFEVLGAGCTATVNWSPGSAPDHADEARILYSSTGGPDFDQLLAVVDLDAGTAEVTLPCTATAEARIKLESVGNVFFDVNPGDFDVVAEPPAIGLEASPGVLGADCTGEVAFEATLTDDCGLAPGDVQVTASLASGTAVVGAADFAVMVQGPAGLLVTGTVPVSMVQGCAAEVEIEVAVADNCGLLAVTSAVAEIADETPPEVTSSPEDLHCLWPPNHRMRCFLAADFAPVIASECSAPVTWRFVDCASDQPANGPGDGSSDPDCTVADGGQSFCVRAQRAGGVKAGRRYAVSIVAEDACGNASDPVVIGHVLVPHAKGCGNAP